LFAATFFWKAAYSGLGTVGNVNEQQMLTYTVMSIVLSKAFSISIEGNIRSRIRKGDVAVDFLKPVRVFGMYLSEDIGTAVTSFIQNAIPVLICSALFIIAPLPSSAQFCIVSDQLDI
jgi:ABC-2 type transport system permease protein